MLSDKQGKNISKYVPDYVVFDLETTGTSCIKDRVVEISAVKVVGGVVTDEFSTLVNPEMHISFWATEVNGITDEMVADAPTFDVALKDFLDFVGDMILVGHNIKYFDMKFICRDALEYFGKTIGNDYIDTLPIAKMYLPEMEHHKLSDLAEHYGISSDGAHRALFDCHMNQQVFEMLAKEMETPSEAAKQIKKCPKCGGMMKLRNGKFGEFYGCSGYPDCRYTENT